MQDAIDSLLARAAKSDVPLPPSLSDPLGAWMAASSPSDVHTRYEGVLDALRDVALAAAPPSAATMARDAVWGLTHRAAAGVAGGSGVAPYPDVRLSAYVLTLSARHAVGARLPPHGAAAARPPPPAVLPVRSGGASPSLPATSRVGTTTSPLPPVDVVLPPQGAGGGAPPHPLPLCPVHTPLAVALTLTNVGRATALVSVRPLLSAVSSLATLVISPAALALKRGTSVTLSVQVHLLRPSIRLDALLAVDVEGGHRLVASVRALGAPTVFGVPLSDVAIAHRDTPGAGGHEGVPLPLTLLRERLFACGGGSSAVGGAPVRGLDEEGLFRVAPSLEERENLRAQLDAGTFRGAASACTGVAAAHMVKQFLRELPTPLFSIVPVEVLLGSTNTEAECLAAIAPLAPPARGVLAWLIDLLAAAAAHERSSKMSAQSLAICTGPNLFAADEGANPMEALMASQKAVALLLRLITVRASGRPIFAPSGEPPLGVLTPSSSRSLSHGGGSPGRGRGPPSPLVPGARDAP